METVFYGTDNAFRDMCNVSNRRDIVSNEIDNVSHSDDNFSNM